MSTGMKPIYVNGVLVGQVPKTGDLTTEMQAVTEFLKSRGLGPSANPFRAIQGQAIAFANASNAVYERYLRTTPVSNGLSAVPFVVNSAFSIELYLKTLHAALGTPQRGHHLLALFDSLPDEMRKRVAHAAVVAAPKFLPPEQAAEAFVFRDVLTNLDNAFVEWRYAHESGKTTMVKIHTTIVVMAALHVVCDEVVGAHDGGRADETRTDNRTG